MGILQRRQPFDPGDRHTSPRHTGPAAGVPDGRDARSHRDRSDGHRDLAADARAAAMTPTPVGVGARALLVAARADNAELEALLRGLGYQPVLIKGTDQVAGVRDPVSLCLIDLRQNGEALRSARAVRS